jgi:hypothetical protein
MLPAVDISKYQGAWQDYPANIVLIRMSSGGTGSLAMDPDAATNYGDAVAAGKAVGGYHYIGWIGAIAEATYFLQAMSPLAENDVYALDAEDIPANIDPVAYVNQMATFIHSKIGVWPLIYINFATLNAHNWDPVLANCGLWLADWNNDPAGTIATVHTYVMQQYSDGPVYDHDEWFGTIAEFNAYGYHAPVATNPPAPSPSPVVQPTPEPAAPAPPQSTPVVIPEAPAPKPAPPVIVVSSPIKKPTVPLPQPKFGTPIPTVLEQDLLPWYRKVLRYIENRF